MDRLLRLYGIAQGAQPGLDDVLKVRLPRIDHVVYSRPMPELLPRFRGLAGSHPKHPAIRIAGRFPEIPGAIEEIFSQQSEFPKLISDVLSRVDNRAVGTHNHLAVFGEARHHPAARVLAFALEVNRLALL